MSLKYEIHCMRTQLSKVPFAWVLSGPGLDGQRARTHAQNKTGIVPPPCLAFGYASLPSPRLLASPLPILQLNLNLLGRCLMLPCPLTRNALRNIHSYLPLNVQYTRQ